MSKYAASGELAAVGSAYKTAFRISCSSTTRRARLYDILLGQGGAPADNAMYWDISRHTAVPTDTAFTPNPLDSADVACVTAAGSNATAEGTVTAASDVFGPLAINQRASYRWVCAPGSEIIVPAVANSGLSVRTKSATYAGVAGGSLWFDE